MGHIVEGLSLSLTGRAGRMNSVHTHFFRVVQAIERSPAVSYILDSELRFVYCNPAWDRFAVANGASQLAGEAIVGRRLSGMIPDVLKPVYDDAFRRVMSEGSVWEKSYECSSPNTFRLFRMRIHLLKLRRWFLITNPPVLERSHQHAIAPDPKTYFDGHGLIMMCAHCRCSRRVDNPDQWDFVSEYL